MYQLQYIWVISLSVINAFWDVGLFLQLADAVDH